MCVAGKTIQNVCMGFCLTGERGCGCHRNVTDSHLVELALGDAVAVVDDARGLEARGLVELDEQLAHHGGQVLDDVLPVLLDAHRGAVAARVGVHAAHHLPPQTRERRRARARERLALYWSTHSVHRC